MDQSQPSSPGSSSLRTPVGFGDLPTELQIAIWGLALPCRTVYISATDVLPGRMPNIPFKYWIRTQCHTVPTVAHVNHLAREVAFKAGCYLRVSQTNEPLLPPQLTWFDAARDTIFIDQDSQHLNGNDHASALEVRVNPHDIDAVKCMILDAIPWLQAMTNSRGGSMLLNGVRPVVSEPRPWFIRLELQRPTRQALDVLQREAEHWCRYDPLKPLTGRLLNWVAHPSFIVNSEELSYVYVSDYYRFNIRHPLPPAVRAEFFPNGSTTAYLDITALATSRASYPSFLLPPTSSSEEGENDAATPTTAPLPAFSEQEVEVLRRKFARLLHAWEAATATAGDKVDNYVGRWIPLSGKEALAELAQADPAARETRFREVRREIAWRWLSTHWKKYPEAERASDPDLRAAALCDCCSPTAPPTNSYSSAATGTEDRRPWEPRWLLAPLSQSQPPPTDPADFTRVARLYRTPGPYYLPPPPESAPCPTLFDPAHPWCRNLLSTMPRFPLGLVVSLVGEAAAAAPPTAMPTGDGGETNL